MGYTHYWTPSKKIIPAAAITLITAVLDHGVEQGIIETDNTEGQALRLSPNEIWFNGIGDNANETFAYEVGGERNFCKTAREPYDLYVCSVLLILKYYIPDFSFSSNGGTFSGEWNEAIQFLVDNSELFNLDQNLIDSIDRVREGEEGNRDLFENFPLYGPDHEDATGEVTFTFAHFCSFSLEREEGETDEELKDRALNHAIEILAEDTDNPVCHDSSNPDMID